MLLAVLMIQVPVRWILPCVYKQCDEDLVMISYACIIIPCAWTDLLHQSTKSKTNRLHYACAGVLDPLPQAIISQTKVSKSMSIIGKISDGVWSPCFLPTDISRAIELLDKLQRTGEVPPQKLQALQRVLQSEFCNAVREVSCDDAIKCPSHPSKFNSNYMAKSGPQGQKYCWFSFSPSNQCDWFRPGAPGEWK